MARTPFSLRSVTAGPGWLWIPVFGIGLAAVLAGPVPPGGLDTLAGPAAARLGHGNFNVSVIEGWAILAVAGWMMMKPLGVMGALLLLEFHFSVPARGRNLALAWAAQAITIGFFVALLLMVKVVIDIPINSSPAALLKVGPASSPLSLLTLQVPALCLGVLIGGFFQYWFHRACHHFPLLWRFHSLHHSLEINALNNIAHPFELALGLLFVSAPTVLLIRVTSDQIVILAAFVYIQGYINHSRLPVHFGPFRFLLSDNRYHFIHHSLDPTHFNKNFGNVPVWDLVFGTYVPARQDLVATGLADRAAPRTLWQYLTVQLPPILEQDENKRAADTYEAIDGRPSDSVGSAASALASSAARFVA